MPNDKLIQKRANSAVIRPAPRAAGRLGLAMRPESLVSRWFKSLNLPTSSSYAHPDLRKAAALRAKESLLRNSQTDSRVVLRSSADGDDRDSGWAQSGTLSTESIGQDVYRRVAPLLLSLDSRRPCDSVCLEGLHEVCARVLEWTVGYLPDRTTTDELDLQFGVLKGLVSELEDLTWDGEVEHELAAAEQMIHSLRLVCHIQGRDFPWEDVPNGERRSRRELTDVLCSYRAIVDNLAVTWGDLGLRASDLGHDPLGCDDPTPLLVHLTRQWSDRWSELMTIDGHWAVDVLRAEARSRVEVFERLALSKETIEKLASALGYDDARQATHALQVAYVALCKVADVEAPAPPKAAMFAVEHPLTPSVEGVAVAVTNLANTRTEYRAEITRQISVIYGEVCGAAPEGAQLEGVELRVSESASWLNTLLGKGVAGLVHGLVQGEAKIAELDKDLAELENGESKIISRERATSVKGALNQLNKHLEEWCRA